MYSSPAITGLYNGPLGRRLYNQFRVLQQWNRNDLAAAIRRYKPVYGRKECLDYLLYLSWLGTKPIGGSAWSKNNWKRLQKHMQAAFLNSKIDIKFPVET